MSNEQWEQVKEIFAAALQQGDDERQAFLEKACADDDLRREVESLLSCYQDDSFLEKPVVGKVTGVVLEVPAKLAKGDRLNHYEIIRQLGAGGMGEVYLAEDTLLKRKAAVKLLLDVPDKAEDHLRRFFQEARSASALNHPNILTIYEIGQTDGTHFIATEYIQGETLRQRLKRTSLTLAETLEIALQIAAALSAAHTSDIIHRDIKPENIMLRADGLVKVLDFGLAKLTAQRRETLDSQASTQAQVQTNPGVILGTVSYMSPEQARGLSVDVRTDIWSFGVVLYEILTGKLPFAGDTTSDVIAAILKNEPAPLAESVVDVPRELEQIIGRTLRKNCEERYQHSKDLLIDLKDLKQEMDFTAKLERSAAPSKYKKATAGKRAADTKTQTAPTTPGAGYIFREIKRHKRGLLTVLGVLLMSAIGLSYWFYSIRPTSTAVKQIESIAVLPLENLSGDPAQDYFADGMTDALINNLAQIRALKVISRASAMRYKGTQKSLSEIARELNVDAVLTGTVRRSSGRVRVTAQLIHAATDTHLWVNDYERDLADVLKLESEIARAIANEIRVQVTADERSRLASVRSINPQAHEAYLLGHYHSSKNNAEDCAQAIEHFRRAIGLAPDYAEAYAGLSEALLQQTVHEIKPVKENVPPARAAALKAIELDEQLAEAHTALGNVKYYYDWDWAGAEKEFERALELNPASLIAHIAYGHLLSSLGRRDEAVREGHLAVQLDPLSAEAYTSLGRFLYRARRYEEALPVFQRAVQLEPRSVGANTRLGSVYAALGRYEEALAVYEKAREMAPIAGDWRDVIAYVYARMGREREARQLVSGLKAFPIDVAGVYAALGDKDAAFRVLEAAIEERKQQLIVLKEDPTLENLHSDPRWKQLLRRLNFPPE